MIQLGKFEIRSVVTGSIRLDGGAMFGIVPKTMWEPKVDVDSLNRILLATRTLMVIDRREGRVVLADTGTGTKWDPAQAERYGVKHQEGALDEALAACGVTREDVTDVVLGHLHFDHNGGVTEWADAPGGPIRPCFPNARHWVHRQHWEHACRPHTKDRASFFAHDFRDLEKAGLLEFVDGEHSDGPLEGWSWFVSHGHTPYQLHPVFQGGGRPLMFIGDIIPTINHLGLAWVMAYDVQPMTTIAEKQSIYQRCAEEGLLLAFPHDPLAGGIELDTTGKKPEIKRMLDL